MKMILTKKQIKAYRLCSGEFEGHSAEAAAKLMGVSSQAVNRLLQRAKKAAPGIFPLLTKQEADVKALLAVGYSNYDLANQLDVSLNRISQIINSLYIKRPNMIANNQPVKILQYAAHMDSQIKQVF